MFDRIRLSSRWFDLVCFVCFWCLSLLQLVSHWFEFDFTPHIFFEWAILFQNYAWRAIARLPQPVLWAKWWRCACVASTLIAWPLNKAWVGTSGRGTICVGTSIIRQCCINETPSEHVAWLASPSNRRCSWLSHQPSLKNQDNSPRIVAWDVRTRCCVVRIKVNMIQSRMFEM